MMLEISKPQDAYNHETVRQIIEDIAQSSIMRLDPISMDRLWDLIVMVFKWQLTLSQDVIGITFRHLYEIETFTTNPETQLQLHRVQTLVDNFAKVLTCEEKYDLRNSLLVWFQNYNVRISLLLRLGFQNPDASFKINNFNPKYRRMLDNLGENIYAASKDFTIITAQKKNDAQKSEKHELNSMISQILGGNQNYDNKTTNQQMFKLMMSDTYEEAEPEILQIYSDISVHTPSSNVQNIFDDVNDKDETVTDLHNELLNIIDDC